jgi:hypothetical protein
VPGYAPISRIFFPTGSLCVNIDVAPKEETSNGLFARRETEYSEESAAA